MDSLYVSFKNVGNNQEWPLGSSGGIKNIKKDVRLTKIHILGLNPKRGTARNITNFKPISLCNFVYNVITKVMASRFKLLLLEIISLVKGGLCG